VEGSFEDSTDLHLGYLWVHDSKSAAAEPNHWVLFMECVNLLIDFLYRNASFLWNLVYQVNLTSWQKLMQGWVQQTDVDWATVHGSEKINEIW